MARDNVRVFPNVEVERLSIACCTAREQARRATVAYRELKGQLKARGYDEFGVSLAVRTEARGRRVSKNKKGSK